MLRQADNICVIRHRLPSTKVYAKVCFFFKKNFILKVIVRFKYFVEIIFGLSILVIVINYVIIFLTTNVEASKRGVLRKFELFYLFLNDCPRMIPVSSTYQTSNSELIREPDKIVLVFLQFPTATCSETGHSDDSSKRFTSILRRSPDLPCGPVHHTENAVKLIEMAAIPVAPQAL